MGIFYRRGVPAYYTITYPSNWVEVYDRHKYFLSDPVVLWSLTNDGARRWSDIKVPDIRGVFRAARPFGLRYGVCISISSERGKSVLSASRDDRELTDMEIQFLTEGFRAEVALFDAPTGLTESDIRLLRQLAEDSSVRESSVTMGISETAAKQKLSRIRKKLGCATNTGAVAAALRRRVFT